MSDQDFLKITIQNILNEISELKSMVSTSTTDTQTRLSELETRVTVLETRLATTKNIFTSPIFIGILSFLLAFIAQNFNSFLNLLSTLHK